MTPKDLFWDIVAAGAAVVVLFWMWAFGGVLDFLESILDRWKPAPPEAKEEDADDPD